MILFDETIRQSTDDGTTFADHLTSLGIVPGIKVDKGIKGIPFCDGETVTEGLDGLGDRLSEYYELGARFTKWRAVISISDGLPSKNCIRLNAHALAGICSIVSASKNGSNC